MIDFQLTKPVHPSSFSDLKRHITVSSTEAQTVTNLAKKIKANVHKNINAIEK